MAGILSKLRSRGEELLARRLQGEAVSFAAEIPGRAGPLYRVQAELRSEPHADGERLRLRLHVKLSLRRRALPPPPDAEQPKATLPVRVGRWIEARLESPLVQRLAEPLLDRDFSSWLEIQASNAALDEGARALLPPQLQALGIEPQKDRPLQTWAGAVHGPKPGFAVLSLLQLDKSRLPPSVREALGPEPLQLTAAQALVVEEA
jgi:hypothetical protein